MSEAELLIEDNESLPQSAAQRRLAALSIQEAGGALIADDEEFVLDEPLQRIAVAYHDDLEVAAQVARYFRKPRVAAADNATAVDRYLADIGPYDHPADRNEELRLFRIMKKGVASLKALESDPDLAEKQPELVDSIKQAAVARQIMYIGNTKLVVSIAKKMASKTFNVEDLIGAGNIGLEHAIIKFNAEKGFKFSTYATWWIRQSMQREKARQGYLVHIPDQQYPNLRRIAALKEQLGRMPTASEIAEVVKVKPEILAGLLQVVNGDVSLNIAVSHDSETELGDMLSDTTVDHTQWAENEAATAQQELAKIVAGAQLGAAELAVMSLRSGVIFNEQLGRQIWISQRYVGRYDDLIPIIKAGLDKMGSNEYKLSLVKIAKILRTTPRTVSNLQHNATVKLAAAARRA